MDEPQPNPNWKYIKLWNQAEQIGIELMTLNAYLINQSCASPSADKRIEELLKTLQNSVGEALLFQNAQTQNKSTTAINTQGLEP